MKVHVPIRGDLLDWRYNWQSGGFIFPGRNLLGNFLKIVKRKLREAESFRDRNWTAVFLRALANVRNFVPFMSGAKNAHKSPFMLADGSTYDLPWIQVMNVHNAFLFVED